MSDNLNNQRPDDTSRIDLEDRAAVDYWCRELGVTPQRLRELIAHVGIMAEDVRRAAAQTHRPNVE